MQETEQLYDASATSWQRAEPTCLSDFTGREALLKACQPVAACRVADLGCGEGYCARALCALGAESIDAYDVSAQMIERGRQQLINHPAAIQYQQADVRCLNLAAERYDLVMASFLLCYLKLQDCAHVFSLAFRSLKSGGRFIFTVPHPMFAFMKSEATPPFYYQRQPGDYFSLVDSLLEGEIFRRDGEGLKVQMYHKTLANYFELIEKSEFKQQPIVQELGVEAHHLAIDPEFFSPVTGFPLHLLVSLTK